MKKFTKIAMAIILTLAVCITFIPAGKVDAKSKSIFYPGEYRKKLGPGEYYVLSVDQYSMGGSTKRPFTISYYLKSSGGMHTWKSGNLKSTGTNKYKAGKMRFQVYKKKIVITGGGEYNGTYNVKIRY